MPESQNRLPFRWWMLLVVAVVFLFPFFGKAVQISVDFLWFKEVQLVSVFSKRLLSKLLMGLVFGAAGFLFLLANGLWARWRGGNGEKSGLGGISLLPVPIEWLAPYRGLVVAGAALLLSYGLGNWAASQWEVWLKYLHATPFGQQDPLFGRDIAFYIFTLPLYRFLFSFAVVVVLLAAVLCVVTHLLGQGILATEKGFFISPPARRQLWLLASLFCALFFFHFHLRMYELVHTGSHVTNGAGFADVKILLPALKLSRFAALISAGLIGSMIWKRKLRWAAAGIILLLVLNLGSQAIREGVQRLIVNPNEIVKETPFIRWSIQNTRAAYRLDQIDEKRFVPNENLTAEALRQNDLTVKNIRLWDHAPLLTTFSQLQEIRTYYEFLDVDNDRYMIDNEYRQVMLSPRELVPASLPSRKWINEHLTYTHGYGLCLGPVNRITPEGLPEFFIKDIPPVSTRSIENARPELYFGEAAAGYAIVNSRSKEFDYPSGDENVYANYRGKGGIPAGGFLKKLLFAIHFREIKLLLSSDIGPKSRILFHRQIMERARKAVPFLRFDRDPYLVIGPKGRLVWVLDAYTVSNRYPYSARSGEYGNYIRNSVKVLIDAYDGNLTFFVADPNDPIIQTYGKVFPGVFKNFSKMPEHFRKHIRYPQTLFTIQANVYATYHMTDPQVFYNKEDLWKIPEQYSDGSLRTMTPYYTIMKLAGVGEQEEFILMVPFSPAKKENMIAWLAARCDEPFYGKLLVFNFPKQKLVYGPRQIESRIDQHPEISKQLTLWNQGGSRVIRGSLLVIPVEESILYVEPLYIAAEDGGGLPELKRVIVAYGNQIAMEENLEESLAKIFQEDFIMPPQRSGPDDQQAIADGPPQFREMVRQANQEFMKAQDALSRGEWAAYGKSLENVGKMLKRLEREMR